MENNPTDYVWRAKANKSFVCRCHIETGNTWMQLGFNSKLGRIERPKDSTGNPLFLVLENGDKLSLRGAVTVPPLETEQMGTVTFTPEEGGITGWHWTITRDGTTYTEEGRGIFQRDEPKPKPSKRARKTRPVAKKKSVPAKKARRSERAKKPKKAKKAAKPARRKQARGRRSS